MGKHEICSPYMLMTHVVPRSQQPSQFQACSISSHYAFHRVEPRGGPWVMRFAIFNGAALGVSLPVVGANVYLSQIYCVSSAGHHHTCMPHALMFIHSPLCLSANRYSTTTQCAFWFGIAGHGLVPHPTHTHNCRRGIGLLYKNLFRWCVKIHFIYTIWVRSAM